MLLVVWVRRLAFNFLICFVLFAAAYGMGGRGSYIVLKEIPRPLERYKMIVTDKMGETAILDYASFNGLVYFTALRGKAVYTIPFSRVYKVEVGLVDKSGMVNALFLFRNGKRLELKLEADARIFGKTDVGNYYIDIKDIKEIEFKY